MVQRKLTIPERWQAVGMHNGGFSHRRVADHFRVNHNSKPIRNKFIIRKDIIETSQVVLNFCQTVYTLL
jgi:hypothetical protein